MHCEKVLVTDQIKVFFYLSERCLSQEAQTRAFTKSGFGLFAVTILDSGQRD